eukprot:5406957-Lingulodinium_polyedra.AAC.1
MSPRPNQSTLRRPRAGTRQKRAGCAGRATIRAWKTTKRARCFNASPATGAPSTTSALAA